MIRLLIMVGLHVVCGKVPQLDGYNPLKDRGFVLDKSWVSMEKKNELSASVADFTHDTYGCRRLVLFSAEDVYLAHVEVLCDSNDLLLGLVHRDNTLWYYGVAWIKKDGYISQTKMVYGIMNIEKKKGRCKKSYFIVKRNRRRNSELLSYYFEDLVSEGPNANEECKILVNPPMLMISFKTLSAKFDAKKFGPPLYLNGPDLLAVVKMYKNQLVCFQRVMFFNHVNMPVTSVIMLCGPLQGVVLKNKAFYYGDTFMLKLDTDEANTFHLLVNIPNTLITPTKTSSKRRYKSNIEEPSAKCLIRTIKLDSNGERIESNTEVTSKNTNERFSKDCAEFVKGQLQGNTVSKDIVDYLITSLENSNHKVYQHFPRKLRGFRFASRSDVNVASDLGLIILSYKLRNVKKVEKMRKMIVVVAKGKALTHFVVESEDEPEEVIISQTGEVYYNWDLIAWQNKELDYEVVIRKSNNHCTLHTYRIETANAKFYKKTVGKIKLDTSDPNCKNLDKTAIDPNVN